MKYLDLSGIDLHEATDCLLPMPPSISDLYMRDCQLTNISPSLKYVNLTSVVILDLSLNNFNFELPHWLFNLNRDLSHLDLENNRLYGEIPSSLFNYQNLEYLDLSVNMFFGFLPLTLGNLTYLVSLNMGYNSFSGTISEMHFSILQNLQELYLSKTRFTFHFNPEWIPPFQLKSVYLDYTNQGPQFPPWIYIFKSYFLVYPCRAQNCHLQLIEVQTLNLSYNHLTGTILKTIGRMKKLESLDLSNNKLFGEIQENMANLSFLSYFNLSFNNFSGQIPIGTQLQSFSVSSYDGNPEMKTKHY
ncbi:receptor-like protein EIX1 [Vigna angularis]|uniref:receptor-like protein EIX1 n=1 Tax=Phaseolus angularis TaxID=3914 RepID=UPI0022B43EA7|nr:receptor-like protein EIX1 [Vigna angularis]